MTATLHAGGTKGVNGMIQYALLGLLREQSDYGYRLKCRFDSRVGTYWKLNIGQVYQTLRALQRAGLVTEVGLGECRSDRGEEHPLRRMFALTSKGGRLLDRWLRRPPVPPRPVRDELLVRLLVHTPDHLSTLLGHVAQQEQLHRSRLARLLSQRERASTDEQEDGFVRRLNLDAAVRHTEAHLGWLEYCRQSLGTYSGEACRGASA